MPILYDGICPPTPSSRSRSDESAAASRAPAAIHRSRSSRRVSYPLNARSMQSRKSTCGCARRTSRKYGRGSRNQTISESEMSTFNPKRSSGATSAQRPACPLRRMYRPEPQKSPLPASLIDNACAEGSRSTTPTRPESLIALSWSAQFAAKADDAAFVNVTNNVCFCAYLRAIVSVSCEHCVESASECEAESMLVGMRSSARSAPGRASDLAS